MQPDAPNGIIWDQLNPMIQSKSLYQIAPMVHQILGQLQTGLASYPLLASCLWDVAIYSQEGWGFLNSVISVMGHPLYNPSAPDIQPPIQRSDQSFSDYYQEMAYYSNMLVLASVFINERYFIYLLVNNAHRQTVGTWLEWLTNQIALSPMIGLSLYRSPCLHCTTQSQIVRTPIDVHAC
jgi:hypothetical protein